MAVTMQDVRAVLDPEEPDYEFAALLGPEALPHLETLVRGDDPMLASKAAYLAGLLNDERSADVVNQAGQSDHATVRVAAAAAARHLTGTGASDVLISLLSDSDPGVRTVALKSVPDAATDDLRSLVEDINSSEGDEAVREVSRQVLQRLSDFPSSSDTEVSGAPAGEMPPLGSSAGGMSDAGSGQGEMPPLGSTPSGMSNAGSGPGEMPPVGSSAGGMSDAGNGPGEMPPLRSSPGEMPPV